MTEAFVGTTKGDDGVQAPATITGTAGEALARYEVVYSDPTDSGKFKKAQSDGTEAQADCIGMVTAVSGINDDASGEITIYGEVSYASWSWTPGAVLYVGTTAGELTETKPSTIGYYVKPVAVALTDNSILFQAQTGWQI